MQIISSNCALVKSSGIGVTVPSGPVSQDKIGFFDRSIECHTDGSTVIPNDRKGHGASVLFRLLSIAGAAERLGIIISQQGRNSGGDHNGAIVSGPSLGYMWSLRWEQLPSLRLSAGRLNGLLVLE